MGLMRSYLMKVQSADQHDHSLRNPGRNLGKLRVFIPRNVRVTVDTTAKTLQLSVLHRS